MLLFAPRAGVASMVAALSKLGMTIVDVVTGDPSKGNDGEVNVADGAGGWRLTSAVMRETSPTSFRVEYATTQFVGATEFLVQNSGTDLLVLNSTTRSTAAAGRLLLYDGTQNLYQNPNPAIFGRLIATGTGAPSAATVSLKRQAVFCQNASPFPMTYTLPSVAAGVSIVVKDAMGNSAAKPITVHPGATGLIDGAATNVINVNWASREYVSNGNGEWFVTAGYL